MQAPTAGLTPREAEVLRSVGLRLNNTEIATRLFISVRTVESHISALLRKLGASNRSELIEIAGRTSEVSGISVPHDSFVGRIEEMAELERLLGEHRLVALVGPGGAGKTRLALQFANALVGPALVDMGGTETTTVMGRIAEAIGLGADATTNPLTTLAIALGTRARVLILDDCDHMLDEVGQAATTLLGRIPELRVLVTARSAPSTPGAAVLHVGPLPIGGPGRGAIELFLDRARAAAPSRHIGDDPDSIEALCRRLDGLPLAIELAAARCRHYEPGEILRLLDEHAGLLGDPNRPGRHSTLDAAFTWSWDLLAPSEQDAMSRLACLPDDFDLRLATAVGVIEAGVTVTRLLDRSMLQPAERPQRFRMLAPIRTFVLGKTPEHLRLDVAEKHAQLFIEEMVSLSSQLRGDGTRQVHDRARELIRPVTSAIDWSLDNDGRLAVRGAEALAVVAEQVGPTTQCLRTLLAVTDSASVISLASVEGLAAIGNVVAYCSLPKATELAERASRAVANDRDQMAADWLAGLVAGYSGDRDIALQHLERASRLAKSLEDPWYAGAIAQALGIAYVRPLPDHEAAMRAFAESMEAYAEAGDVMHVNNVRFMMANLVAEAGAGTPQALSWAEQAIGFALVSGNRHEWAHATLAWVGLTSEPNREERLVEALDVFRSVGDLRCLTRANLVLAGLHPDEAEDLIMEGLAIGFEAQDRFYQGAALRDLIAIRLENDDRAGAAVAYGALIDLMGDDVLGSAAPAGSMVDDAGLKASIAEGRASGVSGLLGARAGWLEGRWVVSPGSGATRP